MQSTQTETWKPVVGFEDSYEVSDLGSVRSMERDVVRGEHLVHYAGTVLSQANHRQGYKLVCLQTSQGKRTVKVHRLVALAFHGPQPEGMEACHNNSDPADNRAVNLRWDTRSGNMLDAVALGRNPSAKKTHCPRRHLLVMPNLRRHEWETKGTRHCYSCAREQDRSRKSGRPFDSDAADEIYRRVMSGT